MLVALVELLSDPKASKHRIQEYARMHAEATAAVAEAQRQKDDADRRLAEVRSTIDREQNEHAARIVAERAAHNDAMARERSEIEALHRSAVEHDRHASAARADAEKLRAEMSRRIRIMEGR
jgi:chromosome segregation ATPase